MNAHESDLEKSLDEDQISRAADLLLKHETVLDPTIALYVVRSLEKGILIESVEPDAPRIAYELWEGKRVSLDQLLHTELIIGWWNEFRHFYSPKFQSYVAGRISEANIPEIEGKRLV